MTTPAFASPELKDLEPWLVEQGAPPHAYTWVLGVVAGIGRSVTGIELVTAERRLSAAPGREPVEVIEVRVDFGNSFSWIGEIGLG